MRFARHLGGIGSSPLSLTLIDRPERQAFIVAPGRARLESRDLNHSEAGARDRSTAARTDSQVRQSHKRRRELLSIPLHWTEVLADR